MPLSIVRNSTEYPTGAEAQGSVVYDAKLQSFAILQPGLVPQNPVLGGVLSVTAAATATPDVGFILAGNTTSYALTLPTAAGLKGKMIYILKTAGTGTVTITPAGSETINGAANKAITTQWTSVILISDGTNWQAVHNAVVA